MSDDGFSSDEDILPPYDKWLLWNVFVDATQPGLRTSQYSYIGGMQVSVRSPHSPRVAYYRRLPIGSPTRAAIEKYLFDPEAALSTTEALEVYRYLRDFAGATVTGISLRDLNRTYLDQIIEACLDAGADPF